MVRTGLNPQISDDELVFLTGQYRYGRYCEDWSLPLEASRRLLFDQVHQLLARNNSQHVMAFAASGESVGLLIFRLSEWDTEHFGYNVAIIDLVIVHETDYERKVEITKALIKEFQEWCQAANIRFVSAKIPALDLPVIHGFESYGFNFIESWVYNKYDLNTVERLGQTPYQLRLTQPDDCQFMLDYATGAFVTHRFHADSHITEEQAEKLYDKWIQTAFEDPGQQILTLDIEDKPVAFMIYYKNDLLPYFGLQFAQWKMAVLDPASRGKGLGTGFFIALAHYHHQDGLDVIDSGLSIRNLASLNLHNKLDFKVISILVTFHKWFW